MFAYIKGTALCRSRGAIIVSTGAVGYRIAVTDGLLHKLKDGQDVELYTHQHVRENSVELYGFPHAAEVDFFEQLLTVSGVGPKGALSILNAAPIEKMKNAIARGDRAIFKGIPGVGARTAERILVELRERMKMFLQPASEQRDDSDIVEALVNFGYSLVTARHAVQTLPDSLEGVEARIKGALKFLAKK